tara:strand:+ start:256 stop:1698 length:1443 start_codon:yes stop_codon:yes gene_type:complete
MKGQYKAIIGLEIHVQLSTKTKAYSSEEYVYGATPNSRTSAISLAHPGTLPVINKKVLDYAVRLGLALNCKIREYNEFARKNYFYADLPKGYQITQDKTPVCYKGSINIDNMQGESKKINITRVHMEEDAGKSIHDLDPFNTLIDLNRAGVPLLEIVTEPDIRNSKEACNFISEIRKIVRYLGICNGNMEEGSMRCDANISVMHKDDQEFGTKVEVKNMNSIANVGKAIDFEISRQIRELGMKNKINQETRSFNAEQGTTFSMRSKEQANDYRYFVEPDLLPVILTKEHIQSIKNKMPHMPNEIIEKITNEFALSKNVAITLTEEKEIANYFLEICSLTNYYKQASNIILGPIKSFLNENALEISKFNVSAKRIVGLLDLIAEGKISTSIAYQKVLPEMISNNEAAEEIVIRKDLMKEGDEAFLNEFIDSALKKYPDKINEYKSGKKGLIGLFMGEIMRLSRGKADPKMARELLIKKLEK